MKNRAITIIICMIVVFAPACVYADVVDEPDDSFVYKYEEYMILLDRKLVANGEDGFAQAMLEPGSKKVTQTVENGKSIFISQVCLYGGDYWGYMFLASSWVRMDELLIPYDADAFTDECGGEFYPCEATLDSIETAGALILWAWPGSGVILHDFEGYSGSGLWNTLLEYAYLDEQGNEWGFSKGLDNDIENIWICISDPSNRDLPALKPATDPAPWTPATTYTDIKAGTGLGGGGNGGGGGSGGNGGGGIGGGGASKTLTLVVVVIIVAAVVVCTILLIKRFYKPKEKASGQDSVDKKA